MSKLITPDSLAKENFERRKKAFVAEIDVIGDKYQISIGCVLVSEEAEDPKTKQKTTVYIPKINIQDRLNNGLIAPTKAPEKPVEASKELKGT